MSDTNIQETYKRVGYCQRCGRCCEGKPLFDSLHTDPNIDQNFRNVLKEASRIFEADLKKMNCPHKIMRHGIAVCTIYNKRPDFCKRHPEIKGDLIEGCDFKFVKIEGGE